MFFFYTNPILIAAAVIPAIVLLGYVYRRDRLEPEPPSLLASLVLRGILATAIAMLAERVGGWLLSLLLHGTDSTVYRLIYFFLVVAVAEEGAKFFLLHRRTWDSPAFNCQFDGVVYAVSVSLGFALWENIGYVAAYGLETALLRAVTAVPGHACFGVFMGVWYALAKRHERLGDARKSEACKRIALRAPVLLHGCYDFVATTPSAVLASLFVPLVVLLFLVSWRLVKQTAETDEYI